MVTDGVFALGISNFALFFASNSSSSLAICAFASSNSSFNFLVSSSEPTLVSN